MSLRNEKRRGRWKERQKEMSVENFDELRRLNGLPPQKRGIKKCLKCNNPFMSEGRNNWVCDPCRDRNREYYDNSEPVKLAIKRSKIGQGQEWE